MNWFIRHLAQGILDVNDRRPVRPSTPIPTEYLQSLPTERKKKTDRMAYPSSWLQYTRQNDDEQYLEDLKSKTTKELEEEYISLKERFNRIRLAKSRKLIPISDHHSERYFQNEMNRIESLMSSVKRIWMEKRSAK